MTPVPRVLLADCDQMFVAVARLVDPEGAGRASLLVVGGRAESRGVVCSASYEARAFGVRSGMPIARAVRLCPDAMFVPVPREACLAKMRRIRDVLSRWAPIVESASIDEFYLDLTATEAVYRGEPLAATAARIRADVLSRTGMRLSIGGGANRLVAKLAAERAKPRPGTDGAGVLIVPPGDEAAFLATHRLAEIPGVGPKLEAALRRVGLVTVPDAVAIDARRLAAWFGAGTGHWLYERIRGRAGSAIAGDARARSMSREETFARDISDDDALETELLALVTAVGRKLRSVGWRARTVSVKLRDHDYRTRQATRTLDESIDSDRAIWVAAVDLLRGLRARRRVPVRLLGIGVARFEEGPAMGRQLTFTPDAKSGETRRDRELARVVDRVNARFGRHALEPARLKRKRPRGPRDVT